MEKGQELVGEGRHQSCSGEEPRTPGRSLTVKASVCRPVKWGLLWDSANVSPLPGDALKVPRATPQSRCCWHPAAWVRKPRRPRV